MFLYVCVYSSPLKSTAPSLCINIPSFLLGLSLTLMGFNSEEVVLLHFCVCGRSNYWLHVRRNSSAVNLWGSRKQFQSSICLGLPQTPVQSLCLSIEELFLFSFFSFVSHCMPFWHYCILAVSDRLSTFVPWCQMRSLEYFVIRSKMSITSNVAVLDSCLILETNCRLWASYSQNTANLLKALWAGRA